MLICLHSCRSCGFSEGFITSVPHLPRLNGSCTSAHQSNRKSSVASLKPTERMLNLRCKVWSCYGSSHSSTIFLEQHLHTNNAAQVCIVTVTSGQHFSLSWSLVYMMQACHLILFLYFTLCAQVVDMRWGVRDEMTNEHMTTDLCMTELRNCQRFHYPYLRAVSREV